MNADLQKKMKRKKEIESSEKRGPLLCFNKTPKLSSRITNISSSSSSSSTVEASMSCLHFLPPSRSSSSSSKSAPQKKPKSIFSTKSANLNSDCSKENISPRPTSQKPQQNAPSTNQWGSGKKPVPRTSQKPNLRADLDSSGKKSRFGSQLISANKGDSKLPGNGSGKQPNQVFNMNNSSVFQDRTPVGKSASGSGLDCANFDGNRIDESTHSSASVVKTPPIEPSVSPEIPYGLSQKPATASAATPCYGAGHVLSGVTDKRKCRPRGVLTVAPVLDLSSRSGKSSESDKLKTSFVPLPVVASMCWISSPSDISGNGQFSGLMGSNPSITTTINPVKSHEGSVLRGRAYAELTPTCSNPSRVENNDSPHSTSTLSVGNVIQTPNSDCEIGFHYELDEATDVLRRASLSSSAHNQMPDSDDPGTSFKFSNCTSTTTFSFVGITECHKHGDSSASCLSESSTGNASESNIRISWRDVSLSRIPAMDSCKWLPDEEDDDEEKDNVFFSGDHQIKPTQSSEDSDDLVMEKVLKLPEFLEQEPCIYNCGMEKVVPQRPSSCAESIFTDDCGGGGLVSSADSDWNL